MPHTRSNKNYTPKPKAHFVLSWLVFFFLALPNTHAQVDSLKNLLKSNLADSARVETLIELFKFYRNSDPAQAETYNKEALALSEALDYQEGLGKALNNYGVYYKNLGDYEKALDYYIKALKVEEALQNKKRIAFAYSNIGTIYSTKKEYDKALESFQSALQIFEKLENQFFLLLILNNIGNVHFDQGNLDEALKYYERALSLTEASSSLGHFDILSNIGNIYVQKQQYNKAREYYELSLDAERNNQNRFGEARALFNLGEVSRMSKNYPSALSYLESAEKIAKNLGDKALLSSIYKSHSDISLEKGDLLIAYSMLKRHMQLKDSLFNEENAKKLAELETLYELDKKEKEIELQRLQIRNQNLFTFVIALVLISIIAVAILIYLKFIQNKRAKALLEVQNEEILRRKSEIEKQKHIIEEKNRDITDSIEYAKGVQDAILGKSGFDGMIHDSFIYFRPKDIVSGDFYWFHVDGDEEIVAAIDCTGHGVAGAFMTIIGNSILNQIVVETHEHSPGKILKQLDNKVLETLANREVSSHGMDAAVCTVNRQKRRLVFAGAKRPMYQIKNGKELIEYKGSKSGIGDSLSEIEKVYEDTVIHYDEGDAFYIFSDGFPDQFGGPSLKKFMTKRFKKLILEHSDKSMPEINRILDREMKEWMNGEEQTDDMLVIGFRM